MFDITPQASEKADTSLFSFHVISTIRRDVMLDALIEGNDIPYHDKSDARAFLGLCMDRPEYQNDLKIILPIARRVMALHNWHAFLTFENIDAFLMNSSVRQMCFLANKIDNGINLDFEAEFMALLAACFISEYNILPERHSPAWWNDTFKLAKR